MKIDPFIAVKNVNKSIDWYRKVFGLKNLHGGNKFAVLAAENDEIVLCLHQWGADDHPTMKNLNIISGNGLLLYFRTDKMEVIRKNVELLSWPIEEEIHLNHNSTKNEFSIRDPDGYYLIISEFHIYEG